MPLNKNENADPNVSTQSALVELTPLEYEKDLPKDQMERCRTQHLASHVPLGWVDGILRPLLMMVHRTAQNEPGSRIKELSGDDEEVHQVLLVAPPSTHIVPEFYIFGNGRGISQKWER